MALIGLLAYVIFAAFGLARAFGGVVKLRKLTVIGFGLSIVGLLESTSLTIYSLTKIQATCKWCIASAITMALLMVAQAWLAQETKQEEQDTDTAMVPSLIAIVAFGLVIQDVFFPDLHAVLLQQLRQPLVEDFAVGQQGGGVDDH